MEPAQRVFAGEFNRSSGVELSLPTAPGALIPRTPLGCTCARVFLVGALTEVGNGSGSMIRARVADPTGTFVLDIRRSNPILSRTITEMAPPVFVAVTGEGRVYRDGQCVIHPETIAPTDRAIRDLWVLRTADITLSRLEKMQGSSLTGEERSAFRDIASMVQTAIGTVRTGTGGPVTPSSRQVVMEMISEQSGPRGVSMDLLAECALTRGISRNELEATVALLVEEGDCYQPMKGHIKVL
jgi:RPA family protein